SQNAVREQTKFTERQRRLRPDVGVVHVHLHGILPGVSRERLLCDRCAADSKGGDAPVEWKSFHHDGGKHFRAEHLCAIRSFEWKRLGITVPAASRIEEWWHDRFHHGTAAKPVGNKAGCAAVRDASV